MSRDSIPGWFIALWILCLLLGLGMTGLVAWAIYRLVVHFT